MLSKANIKYFPFCPGIPWKFKNGKYVIPTLDKTSWDRLLNNRNPVVLCFGGLIESVVSLSILEALNNNLINKNLNWCGDQRFNQLVYLNGLASTELNLSEDIVFKYPLPIFLDKEKFAYFNCLNNYIDVYSISKSSYYYDKRPIFQQIFEKSCLEWNNFFPKFRRLAEPIEFRNFERSKRFNFKKPFILLIPDKTGWSDHNFSYLGWKIHDIRSFSAIISNLGFNLVIMSPQIHKYQAIKALHLKPNLEHLIWLLSKAKVILSEDIDILLLGLLTSSAKIISLNTSAEFSLIKNKNFVKAENKIIELNKINVLDVCERMK